MSQSPNPNDVTLFAGLSGAELSVDHFDFGNGVSIESTFAHLMNPYVVAFSEAERGKPHPAPWKLARGGSGFDVVAQLTVPEGVSAGGFDHLNTVWWFVALLRLKASSFVRVTVLSDMPFSDIPDSAEEPTLWPLESSTRRMVISKEGDGTIDDDDLKWVMENWQSAAPLMSDGDFGTAFSAFDRCATAGNPNLALMMLWGGLERLFSPARHELRFRISATIASYLYEPGEERQQEYKRIKELYDARSRVAHGADHEDPEPLVATHALLRRGLIKMIEENHVPRREELEELLFGVRRDPSASEHG